MLISEEELERRAAELRAKLADWELGYLVGLVEGEGSLDVVFYKRTGRGYPRIQVYNTDSSVLNYFRNKLNIGHVYIYRQERGNHKTTHGWNIRGKEGLVFLKTIFNGLFSCKKIKASLLLALNLNNGGTFVRKIKDRVNYLNSIEESVSLNKPQRSKFSVKNNMTEFNLGIIAGLLDSEGHVGIYKVCGRRYISLARVGITSTCPKIIYKILKLSQGWGLEIRDRGPRRKQYYLTIENQNALTLLELIKDYLIIKKERAEIVIEFIKTLNRPGTRYIPDEVKRRREELYYRLRALNVRGRAYSGGPSILAPVAPSPPSLLRWGLPRPLVSLDV